MAWQPPADRRQTYRFLLTLAVGLAIGTGAVLVTDPASADADLALDDLTAADINRTVSGNVTGATLQADLTYEYTAPDADAVLVELKAGRSPDDLRTVTFRRRDVAGSGTGDVTLSGTLADAGVDPLTLDPSVAGRTNTTLYVAATITVQRTDADPVTHTVVEPVTITLRDDATLEATIGGDVTIDIETSG